MEVIPVLLLALLAAVIYFGPTLIASSRRHKNGSAICVLNLFLGWTFIGWVAALIWAFTDNVRAEDDKASPGVNLTVLPTGFVGKIFLVLLVIGCAYLIGTTMYKQLTLPANHKIYGK